VNEETEGDPQEAANRKIIEHLREVYCQGGEEALRKRTREIIKLIEEWGASRTGPIKL